MVVRDPNTLTQFQNRRLFRIRTPSVSFQGVLDATILDTDVTNPALPPGTCRVTVPSYATQTAFGPAPYPGTTAPPNGASCIVSFTTPVVDDTTGLNVRILTIIGASSDEADILDPFLLMGA